jgi:hypothetical protein
MEFKEMTLEEVKEKLYFVTVDKQRNQEMKEWVLESHDCFGRGYSNDNKDCKDCTAAAKVAGIPDEWKVWAPLKEWCRQLCERDKEGKVTKLQTKLELLRAFRERKVSNE